MSASRKLRAAGATDVGRQRTTNEDRFHIDLDRGIFIVADGVGGHAAGEVAAETAIAAMTERLSRETGPPADRLREAITIANNEIYRLASTRAGWHGMACVLTALVADGDRAFVGHVGDSRLYRITGDAIDKITPDHSPVGEREDANELSEAEAMRHPRRNEVFRDVGSAPHEVTDPDFVFIGEVDMQADGALVLCSDGLTDLVPSDVIQSIALKHRHAPEAAAQALVDAANAAGGKDNVTVVFVTPNGAGPAALAADGPRTGRLTGTPGLELRHPLSWLLAAIVILLATFAAGQWTRANGWTADAALGPPPTAVIVRPDESIARAIAAAQPGVEILVEPGEYRERVPLASYVRVVSRVPRGATIRLPDSATIHDAAVVADGIRGAELRGFRIVGDGATPLATGVLTRNASVHLADLEVTGTATAAIDIGVGEDVTLVAADIHDNAGAAVILRSGSTARVANGVFTRNATAIPAAASIVAEPGATPSWLQNLFVGTTAATIQAADPHTAAALSNHSWFIQDPSRSPVPAMRPGARR